jgi:hypothetical protein
MNYRRARYRDRRVISPLQRLDRRMVLGATALSTHLGKCEKLAIGRTERRDV